MPSTRDKTRRLRSEFDPVSPPLSGQPRYAHSFAPLGSGLQMDAEDYLDWRRSNYPFHPPRKHMQGDVDPEREAEEVTSHNFWGAVIPPCHGRMDRINERLCAQLIGFAMCYVEVAATQIARRLQVPLATPQEIFSGLLDIGLAQGPVLGHDVWRYAKCVEHPLIGAAVFNAVHHAWGAPANARAQSYPPPEDPFVTVRLPDEPPRVAVPLPQQCDATDHQHRQFPPGEGWPWRPGPRRKEPTLTTPNPPAPAPPPPAFVEDNPAAASPSPHHVTLPPDEDERVAPVDPVRFLDAAQAAFAVGATYHNPHSEMLLALVERLAEPVSTGLTDPFAPALRVLVNALYGPSRAYWDETSCVFRRRYLAGGDRGEAEAATQRWRALMSLGEEVRTTLHEWCLAPAADDELDRACGLVAAAARVPLQRLPCPAAGTVGEAFHATSFLVAAMHGDGGLTRAGKHAPAAEAVWKGFFDRRLFVSSRALSPLAQRFLAFLTRSVGARGSALLSTHKVWADDLAEQRGLDLHTVRAAFAHADPVRSPAHELFGRRVALTDWHWSDFAPEPRELPWLEATPTQGQDDGCLWQEVTLTRALLPYLRRLRLYLDRLPLIPAASEP